ncbi:MAG: hypothetical protein AB2411_02230 [Mesobacillus sp.]
MKCFNSWEAIGGPCLQVFWLFRTRIDFFVLETDGSISVIKKSDSETNTLTSVIT